MIQPPGVYPRNIRLARRAAATTRAHRAVCVQERPRYGRPFECLAPGQQWVTFAAWQREPAGAGLDRHHGNHVAALSPRAGREAIAYGHWFDQDAERREGRRGRLAEAQPFVPPLLWLVLGLGAGLVVGYMLMFADPREHFGVQAMMSGAVTAIVVSGLLIVGFLDTPYDDRSGSIRPTEMERTLKLIEQTRAPSLAALQIPCDVMGRTT